MWLQATGPQGAAITLSLEAVAIRHHSCLGLNTLRRNHIKLFASPIQFAGKTKQAKQKCATGGVGGMRFDLADKLVNRRL